ncbi:hypothetical protein G6F68_012987 [Rhizopus microsporus]|nr:hypothetical protein G6F68_012987 [Rhizopus microsporus]
MASSLQSQKTRDDVRRRAIMSDAGKQGYLPKTMKNLAKDITMYDQQYHIFISKQKQTGHTIVGYVRKSTGGEIQRIKERLLQKTIDKIKIRSCVDKVYASYSSSASHLLPGELIAETAESD